jgi:hypothetical protein
MSSNVAVDHLVLKGRLTIRMHEGDVSFGPQVEI